MLDGKNRLRDDNEFAGEKEIVDTDDRASKRIFDGSEQSVGGAFLDRAEGGIKRGAGNGSDGGPEKLKSGFFAESAGLALEGDTHLHFSKVRSAHNFEWPR